MEHSTSENIETPKWKLYKRRWFFLALLTLQQMLIGIAYSMFGQISAFFVKYFHVNYIQVDWLTLAIYVAPIFLTFPFAWLAFRRIFGFRVISITCAAATAFGFACFATSMASSSLFPVSVIGQSVISVAALLVLITPSPFAALWFPENEVGTAIGVNSLGLYVGYVVATTVPAYAFRHKSSNGTAAAKWFNEDKMLLLWIYLACFALAAVIVILLCVFVTDTPPTPPTIAQKKKQADDAVNITDRSWSNFLSQTKAVLSNRTFLSAALLFAIVFQTNTVEFTMMAEIVRQVSTKRHLHLDPSIVGGWTITSFAFGNIAGTIAAGKLVDKYKRYDRISIAGSFLLFLSSVVILLGLITAYELFYVGNFLQGFFIQVAMVTVYDMVAQQMYPIDETVVTVWLVGLTMPPGIFYGEIGRVLYDSFGGMGVLAFQSASLLCGFFVTLLLRPVYGRLDVPDGDHAASEGDRLLRGQKPS